jgi:hypothetical protein
MDFSAIFLQKRFFNLNYIAHQLNLSMSSHTSHVMLRFQLLIGFHSSLTCVENLVYRHKTLYKRRSTLYDRFA